jgi:hypothetical protein
MPPGQFEAAAQVTGFQLLLECFQDVSSHFSEETPFHKAQE